MTREDVAIIQERRMSQQQQPPSEIPNQNTNNYSGVIQLIDYF
jgi:hypothetical protein